MKATDYLPKCVLFPVGFLLLSVELTAAEKIKGTPTNEKPPTVAGDHQAGQTRTEPTGAAEQYSLGLKYLEGRDSPTNNAEAAKWFRKAADQGYAAAQFKLGVCCSWGWGVPKDVAEATKWYRKAADQGFTEALRTLALHYYRGDGVPKDNGEAAKLFKQAAKQGDAASQSWLGHCYEFGEGVPIDRVAAWMWYDIADASGVTDLEDGRRELVRKMAPSQLAEARRRSKEWQTANPRRR